MGWNGELIANSDYSSAGYLTIPIEASKHFKNAVKYYGSILDDVSRQAMIVLRGSDQWVVKKYGKRLPKGWKVFYHPNGEEDDKIVIEFENGKDAEFGLFGTYDDIMYYYHRIYEPIVKYKLKVSTKQYASFKRCTKSQDIKLPPSWKIKRGGSGSGRDDWHWNYTVYGPQSDRKEAVEAINEFYSGACDAVEDTEYTLKKEKTTA